MLQVKNIYFSRFEPILNGIDLSLKSGFFLGIVGSSGAGKSTLLKIIAGLLDADPSPSGKVGKILLDGELIPGPKDRLIPGHPEIQLVNQDFVLDIHHTCEENILLKAQHLPKNLRQELCEELLDLLELGGCRKNKAQHLSGGEQQRLALARALAGEPKVLLLDEPFAHLDVHLKDKITRYLIALNKIRKTSFILVTHDGQEVLSLAQEIAYLKQGKIQRIAKPEDFYFNPESYDEGLFFGQLNQVRINRKTHLFRPNQFQTQAFEHCLSLEIKARKIHFYGNYYLHECLFKNQIILLQSNSGEELPATIYIADNSNGKI